MKCPRWQSAHTDEYQRKTSLGYRIFRCRACQPMFNERTGTPFHDLHCPMDIIMLVVLWRLRYKLSLRDLVEMFAVWGYDFARETVRDWEGRFAPLLAQQLRQAARVDWKIVVCGSDVCQDPWSMALLVPCHRPRASGSAAFLDGRPFFPGTA